MGPLAPEGHLIHTLMEEHRIMLEMAEKLIAATKQLKARGSYATAAVEMIEITRLLQNFQASQNHYLREENVLFPTLDKLGFSGPPAVMWSEHNQIRDFEKTLYPLLEQSTTLPFAEFVAKLESAANTLSQLLTSHFFKENSILFPHALEMLQAGDWETLRAAADKVGYCPFSPASAPGSAAAEEFHHKAQKSGEGIPFETGALTMQQIEAIFATLPVEITFIDHTDTLRFFSQSEDPIFVRSTASLGVTVQNCHPQKSLHLVNQILADFRSKKRDVAEFWLPLKGKLAYIRYFAVRDKKGEYLGCMEVTQDIKDLKKIEGEKRLL
jgi:DUF438 domain-containing protein